MAREREVPVFVDPSFLRVLTERRISRRQALQGMHRLAGDPGGIQPPPPCHRIRDDRDLMLAGELPYPLIADAQPGTDLDRGHPVTGQLADQLLARRR